MYNALDFTGIEYKVHKLTADIYTVQQGYTSYIYQGVLYTVEDTLPNPSIKFMPEVGIAKVVVGGSWIVRQFGDIYSSNDGFRVIKGLFDNG